MIDACATLLRRELAFAASPPITLRRALKLAALAEAMHHVIDATAAIDSEEDRP
jgi:hypothetical protein